MYNEILKCFCLHVASSTVRVSPGSVSQIGFLRLHVNHQSCVGVLKRHLCLCNKSQSTCWGGAKPWRIPVSISASTGAVLAQGEGVSWRSWRLRPVGQPFARVAWVAEETWWTWLALGLMDHGREAVLTLTRGYDLWIWSHHIRIVWTTIWEIKLQTWEAKMSFLHSSDLPFGQMSWFKDLYCFTCIFLYL